MLNNNAEIHIFEGYLLYFHFSEKKQRTFFAHCYYVRFSPERFLQTLPLSAV
jgi:hypothetical protein